MSLLFTGVHVVLDVVGGMFFDASLKCTQWGTRVLIVGFASGQIPKVPTNIALVKNLAVHGVYWGAHFYNDPQVLHDSMSELLSWISQGKLAVHVSHRSEGYSFEKALETQNQATGSLQHKCFLWMWTVNPSRVFPV